MQRDTSPRNKIQKFRVEADFIEAVELSRLFDG